MSALNSTLSHAKLLEVLEYNPLTGLFTWKVTNNNRVTKGSQAGSPNNDGYIGIKIFKTLYRAHRLAWFYVNGEWPMQEIDHIDRVRSNNALSNLRVVSRSENMQNAGMQRNNTSGTRGVSWHKKTSKWSAYIILRKKQIHLGVFACIEDAIAARISAKNLFHTSIGQQSVIQPT